MVAQSWRAGCLLLEVCWRMRGSAIRFLRLPGGKFLGLYCELDCRTPSRHCCFSSLVLPFVGEAITERDLQRSAVSFFGRVFGVGDLCNTYDYGIMYYMSKQSHNQCSYERL